jgi:hypothetical protein
VEYKILKKQKNELIVNMKSTKVPAILSKLQLSRQYQLVVDREVERKEQKKNSKKTSKRNSIHHNRVTMA